MTSGVLSVLRLCAGAAVFAAGGLPSGAEAAPKADVAGWRVTAEIDGRTSAPDRVTPTADGWRLGFGAVDWVWHVAEKGDRLLVRSELVNGGGQAVSLGRLVPYSADAGAFARLDGVRALDVPRYWGQGRRRALPVSDPKAPRVSQIKFQFACPSNDLAWQVGFVTFRRLLTLVEYETDANGRLSRVTASGDFGGWKLGPGETTPFEEFTVMVGKDPFRQLETWADEAADRIRPRFSDESALGCTAGGWSYRDGPKGLEEAYLDNMDAVNERLPGYGFKYLWLSNHNIPEGNPGDWLGWNAKALPHGCEWFVGETRKRGFEFGLWIAPTYVSSLLTNLVSELDDALYRDPRDPSGRSKLVVFRQWSFGDAGKKPLGLRPDIYALDPSHPKAREYIARCMGELRRRGVRYYMVDFICAGANRLSAYPAEQRGDRRICRDAETLTALLRTVRAAAGDDTYILVSSGPTIHTAGSVDAVRTSTDFGECRGINPDSFLYPGGFALGKLDFWMGPERALDNAASYYTHRKLYLNDLGNVLTVDRPLPLEHARISAAIHCFAGSSTMLGDHVRHLGDDRLALVRQTFPRWRYPARPVDLFTHDPSTVPCVQLLEFDGFSAYAVYNLTRAPAKHVLARAGDFIVWDFFNQQFLGSGRDRFEVEVPPESCRIYRLTRRESRPQLMGGDTSMTSLDLAEAWQEGSGTLSLTLRRPASERGNVFVHAPPGWFVRDVTKARIAKDMNTNDLVICVPCRCGAGGEWSGTLEFGRIGSPEDGGDYERRERGL